MTEEMEVRQALEKGLSIEQQGYVFYKESARLSADENAVGMFVFLAGEEEKHFNIILDVWSKQLPNIKPPEFKSQAALDKVFIGKMAEGGRDELDALNIGIEAEKNSISLYSYLAKRSDISERSRNIFDELRSEEEKHLAILHGELEFVTQTGEYTDFKNVTA